MSNRGRRYTEAQIIAILKEAEIAATVGEVIRRHGVAPKPTTGGRPSTPAWRSATPSGCGRSRTRTGG